MKRLNMKLLNTLGLIATCMILSACEEGHYEDEPYGSNDYPEIYDYEIIDSYNVSNLDSGVRNLYVNPFKDDGYFEIYWEVDSFHAFSTGIYVNNTNSIFGAIELDYNTCSNTSCNKGFAYCYFDRYDRLSCSSRKDSVSYNISNLFRNNSNQLYLLIEVCDQVSNLCTSRSQPVIFE